MTYNLLQSLTSTYMLQYLSNSSGCYKYVYANIKINNKYYYTY